MHSRADRAPRAPGRPFPRVLLAALAASLLFSVTTGAQTSELRASWRDLETWSRPIGSTGETERGLGLHLSGAGGTVMVAFLVRTGGRAGRNADVTVQVSTGPLVNPNRVQTPTLVWSGKDGRSQSFRIDLSSRLTVDNPAPGAQVTSGVASMRSTEFERLASATALTATALGLEVSVRPDQLEAIRALR